MKSLKKVEGRANRDERKNEKVLSADQFKRWEDIKDQRNQLKQKNGLP
jgi:hypothetical protein